MQQIINYIPYYTIIFIGNLFYNFFFQKLNKISLKKNWIAFLICICNNYLDLKIKSFIVFLIMCINFKILYNLNLKRTVSSYIIIFLILMILEIIVTNVLSFAGLLNNSEGANYLNYIKICLSILVVFIEYLLFLNNKIVQILRKILFTLENMANIINFSLLMYMSILIIGILNIDNFASKGSIVLLICLFIIFGIVSLFYAAFVSVVSIILALIMLVMAYNNHYIFKRKAMTWIYLAFGIFILISELLGIMA